MTRTDCKALTLIELLMAVAILALALVPIVDLVLRNSRQTRHSSERLFATIRARMVLERYRVLSPARLAQLFPLDGSGSRLIELDGLLSVPGTPGTSAPVPAAPLSDADYEACVQRDARFPVQLVFTPSPSGLSGRLSARVEWSPASGKQAVTVLASEWLGERN
jgi:prepilin-type N-terminal cleavage/methylation domain-containing protein